MHSLNWIEDVLAANICFIPASSNFSKPFVTLGEIGPDGLLRLLTSKRNWKSRKNKYSRREFHAKPKELKGLRP